MYQLANETKHRLVFLVGVTSIVCAGILTMRIVGPFLIHFNPEPKFQLHRYLTAVANGEVKVADSKTFIVIGDLTAGRALPLDEKVTGSAHSFAVHSGTIFESYLLLRRYLEHHKTPPCLVLMTNYGGTTTSYPELFWPDLVGQNFYRSSELEELYRVSAEHDIFPAKKFLYPEYRLLIAGATVFNQFDWRTIPNLLFRPYSAREARQHYRRARAGRGTLQWRFGVKEIPTNSAGIQEHLSRDFSIDPLADYTISRLAGIEGASLLILNPPLSDKLRSAKSEQWFRQFAIHIEFLTRPYPNIILSLQSPWQKNFAFYDLVHHNGYGDHEFLQSKMTEINACVTRSARSAKSANP